MAVEEEGPLTLSAAYVGAARGEPPEAGLDVGFAADQRVRGHTRWGAGLATRYGQQLEEAGRLADGRSRARPPRTRARLREVEVWDAIAPLPDCFLQAENWDTAVTGWWKWPEEHA